MSDIMGDDPAADFLQAEGDELRELGIDDSGFTLVSNEPVDQGGDDFLTATTTTAITTEDDLASADTMMDDADFVNDFDAHPSVEPFESEALAEHVIEPTPEPQLQPVTATEPLQEPQSLIDWRTEKAALLQQQEKEEQDTVVAWADKAKKETEDWYTRYNAQQEKVRNENRAAETQFLEEMTDTKPGNEWEKVSRFCDFNPKMSKNTKDVSRMRSLLLQLKQTPLVR